MNKNPEFLTHIQDMHQNQRLQDEQNQFYKLAIMKSYYIEQNMKKNFLQKKNSNSPQISFHNTFSNTLIYKEKQSQFKRKIPTTIEEFFMNLQEERKRTNTTIVNDIIKKNNKNIKFV